MSVVDAHEFAALTADVRYAPLIGVCQFIVVLDQRQPVVVYATLGALIPMAAIKPIAPAIASFRDRKGLDSDLAHTRPKYARPVTPADLGYTLTTPPARVGLGDPGSSHHRQWYILAAGDLSDIMKAQSREIAKLARPRLHRDPRPAHCSVFPARTIRRHTEPHAPFYFDPDCLPKRSVEGGLSTPGQPFLTVVPPDRLLTQAIGVK